MNIKYIEKESVMNGDGIRVVIWCSGCSHHCKGCHNPETWDPNSGEKFTEKHLEHILQLLDNPYIKGVTFSGGDPLHSNNIEEVTRVCKILKSKFPDKNIWLYTGYLWDEVKEFEIMEYIDVLVDGPFILSKLDVKYPWAGSTNQRVIDVKKELAKTKEKTKLLYAEPVIKEMFKNWVPEKSLTIYYDKKDERSAVYVRNKIKQCEKRKVAVKVIDYDEWDGSHPVDNFIFQTPVPLNKQKIVEQILSETNSEIDADKYGVESVGIFRKTKDLNYAPATPAGVMHLLDYYGVELSGKSAVVIGRSETVGKPMAELLTNANCTVTLCHSKTENISSYTKNADIIVLAIGSPKFLTADMVKQDAVVIDIGINKVGKKIVGDADFNGILGKVAAITPVPGGVGPMTVATLVHRTGKIENEA